MESSAGGLLPPQAELSSPGKCCYFRTLEKVVENQRKRALWFGDEVLEKNVSLPETNKDIKWTSPVGTLKESFIQF